MISQSGNLSNLRLFQMEWLFLRQWSFTVDVKFSLLHIHIKLV